MPEDFIIENGVLTAYRGEAHSIVIPEGVSAVGSAVFKGMAWLTEVTLPEGLTEIGDNAFKGCRQLSQINFPEGLRRIGDFAFHRCHALVSALLPDSVESIGTGAFLYCDRLESVCARGVRRIERQTFANNTRLSALALNSEIDCSNFRDDIFTGCVRIREITLSDGTVFEAENLLAAFSGAAVHPVVRAIAGSVYQSLELENGVLHRLHIDLRDFALPEGIRCIGRACFFDKLGILSITFPASLARICANAFGNCINLEQITLQSADITIDDGAFRGCSSLKTVVIGDTAYRLTGIRYAENTPYIIRRISDQLLSGFYISGRILMRYTGRENRVTVPEGVEIIGESCFAGNDKINRVILSETVREIRENAFRNCTSLQSLEGAENLRVIRRGAFENCKKLLRFTPAPESISEIGFAAFRGCKKLALPQIDTGTPDAVRISERAYGADDIAAYSFCGDASLTELVLEKPAVIGKYAFSACPNLREVIIDHPGCIIETRAFEKCNSLRTVRVRAGKIEKGAFSFCRNLETAEIAGTSALGDEAFAGCSSLRSITLPDTLTEIGRRCFDECTALTGFDFSAIRIIGERAFERCDGLRSVTLTKAAVGYHAFADCAGLRRIVLDSETELQSGALIGCTLAEQVVLDGRAYPISRFSQSRNTADNPYPVRVQEVIGSVYACFAVSAQNGIEAYSGDAVTVRIPDDIVSAEDEAFRDRLRVTEILFPAGFQRSGKLTFAGTGWLEKRRRETAFNTVNGLLIDAACCGETAEIPEDIVRICSWAFAGNTALRTLILKSSRIAVDAFAFRNCINLKTVQDADGRTYTLSHIGDLTEKDYPELVRRIFTECLNCFKLNAGGILEESTGNIRHLVFPGGIRGIGDQVYMDCNLLESIVLAPETAVIGKSAFRNSKWLRSVQNADGVERIEAQAFSGCKSLESVALSDRLEFIGKRAFEHCCSLKEIRISDKVTVIPERAFFRCKSLRKLVIPASVREIGPQAFAYCSELAEVVYQNPESVRAAEDAFAQCDKL